MIIEFFLLFLFGSSILAIATLAWTTVSDWISENTTSTSTFAEIIRQKISNGSYKVLAGVIDKHNNYVAKNVWEAEKLDDELRSNFGSRDTIKVEL